MTKTVLCNVFLINCFLLSSNYDIVSFFYILVKPHNPMVSSGAIMISSLIQAMVKPEISLAEKFEYVYDYIKVMSSQSHVH